LHDCFAATGSNACLLRTRCNEGHEEQDRTKRPVEFCAQCYASPKNFYFAF
jgi:hypothetical protein